MRQSYTQPTEPSSRTSYLLEFKKLNNQSILCVGVLVYHVHTPCVAFKCGVHTLLYSVA